MNPLYKIFCRAYQFCFHIALPFLPYREPKKLENTNDITKVINDKGIKSVLLVTDEVLVKSEKCTALQNSLRDNNIHLEIYDKTCPNPTVHNVIEAKELYLKGNCRALIAYGGGSAMDCAKAVGALIAYPKKSLNQLQGLLRVLRKLPTIFAIPTTAGTGSEVTVTAVITDSEKKHKYTMNNFTMIPHYAALDAEVTYTLPQSLTATTGMDALTHAVEAYIGRSTSKETRRLSLEAVKMIFDNIETAYNDGTNRTARENMLNASYKAGIAFSKSYVGYVHAVAHSLGGQYNIPHGFANAVLLPIVLRYYDDCVYDKLKELAVYAGISKGSDSPKESAQKFISAIESLNERLNIPKHISGIHKEGIKQMAKHAAKEANPLYPVPKLMNAEELEVFYHLVAEKERKQ